MQGLHLIVHAPTAVIVDPCAAKKTDLGTGQAQAQPEQTE